MFAFTRQALVGDGAVFTMLFTALLSPLPTPFARTDPSRARPAAHGRFRAEAVA